VEERIERRSEHEDADEQAEHAPSRGSPAARAAQAE